MEHADVAGLPGWGIALAAIGLALLIALVFSGLLLFHARRSPPGRRMPPSHSGKSTEEDTGSSSRSRRDRRG